MKPERLEELVELLTTPMINDGCLLRPRDLVAIRDALLAVERETREEDAKVCEAPEPECCGRPDRHYKSGEIIGCCGSPEPRPKNYGECAAAIRSLLTEE